MTVSKDMRPDRPAEGDPCGRRRPAACIEREGGGGRRHRQDDDVQDEQVFGVEHLAPGIAVGGHPEEEEGEGRAGPAVAPAGAGGGPRHGREHDERAGERHGQGLIEEDGEAGGFETAAVERCRTEEGGHADEQVTEGEAADEDAQAAQGAGLAGRHPPGIGSAEGGVHGPPGQVAWTVRERGASCPSK